jgi:hypothetical protein
MRPEHVIGDELGAGEVGEHGCALRGERLLAESDLAVVGARHEPVRHLHVEAEIIVIVELTEARAVSLVVGSGRTKLLGGDSGCCSVPR